jgi:hypothetical protein
MRIQTSCRESHWVTTLAVRNVNRTSRMILTATVPDGRSLHDITAACREALTRFAALEPSVAALTAWLTGPYRAALVRPLMPVHVAHASSSQIEDAQRTLDDFRHKAHAATFVADLPPRVYVARIEDARGNVGFAPCGGDGSLVDRVIALFVADYLMSLTLA